jgi:hypothetical protein
MSPMSSKSTVVLALAIAASLGACGSNPIKSLQNANPFAKANNLSDTDRVFLMAAGSWDRNKDNKVTCDEWKAYATELFNGADASHDDMLDATEWPTLSKTDRMFDTANLDYFDANHDGKVTRAEFTDRPNPAFKLLDTANTCILSGSQIAGARSRTQYDVSGKKADEGGDAKDKVQRPGGSGDPTDVGSGNRR